MNKKTSNQTRKKIVLLDAHAILHRAYHALPDFSSHSGEPTGALYGVVTMIVKIIEYFSPDSIIACFDLPDPTYRHDAYTEYKGTRKKTDEALISQINRSREILQAFGIPIYEKKGFEADDVLGTLAKKLASEDTQVIIASGDMDTMQCVDDDRVVVFTLKRSIKETVLYDEKAVQERFGFPSEYIPDYKGLRGDASDNIPGIAGIGEKTATQLIQQFGSLESIYETLKESEEKLAKAGIKPRIINLLKEGEEEATFSKMLATIRTDVPVDFDIEKAHWKTAVDMEALEKLFSELSFRSLIDRVNKVVNPEIEKTEEVEDTDTEEIEKIGIALWLLESETTNPKYEDVIAYGRARGLPAEFKVVKEAILSALEAHDLKSIYEEIELPLRKVLREMEQHGILLNQKHFTKLSKDLHQKLDSYVNSIYQAAGKEFNLNSPKQLGEVLYDDLELSPKNAKKTAGGQRSTRESELEKLRDVHPVIEYILQYREVQKLVSTYVDPLPKLCDAGGRLHTTFLQTGTTTGRLASRDPNLQNIPTRNEAGMSIRRGFVAETGYQLVSIDYSQIELRIASILSQDEKLLSIFKNGEDVHTGVAVRVFRVEPEEVTSEMRRQAKVINFGILYGMGVNALRANLGKNTTRQEAQEFLQAYFNTFTRLAEYLEEVKEVTRKQGYTTTLFGRRRYFPSIKSHIPYIKAQAERMAINAPVQGTASDVMRIAMNQVYSYIHKQQNSDDVRMLIQVHDELLFEIKDSLVETVIPDLVTILETVIPEDKTYGIPITVDVEVGDNWADLKNWKLDK